MSFPAYDQYKECGVEWLNQIPKHWSISELKYVCTNQSSNVDKKSVAEQQQVLLCNYTDVYYNDVIATGMDFMKATATDDQIAKFTLRAGDVIITKDSETADDIAVAAYVPNDLPGVICGYHLAIIRPKSGVCGAFVKRLFDSTFVRSRVATLANGLTRVGLGQSAIAGLKLPIPPLEEQEAIAKFLDAETSKIDALVAEQRRLIELLAEKRQAVISHAVTKGLDPHVRMKPSGIEWLGDVPEHWEVKKVKYGITKIEQGFSPQCHSEPAAEDEWGVVKVGCCNKFDLNEQEQKRLPTELEPVLEYEIRSGDVLMSRGNTLDLVGMAALVRDVRPRLLLCDLVYRFRALEQVFDPAFLVHSLRSKNVRSQIECNAVGSSSTMKKVSQELARNLIVCCPAVREQRQISEHIANLTTEFDLLETNTSRAIATLQERRTALISAAVTGKIDVRARQH